MSDRTDPSSLRIDQTLPEPQAPPRRSPGRVTALWIGIVALFAGGIFAVAFVAADDEGSPEEAVRRMLRALADEDVIGVLEALPPSEREVFQAELPRLTEQLERLEILGKGFRLEQVKGVDLSFRDIELSSRTIGDGVSAVRITGGRVSYSVIPAELELGGFLEDLVDLPTEPQTGSEPIVSDDPDDNEPIIVILEDGRWHVSLYYSIAEGARAESGAPVPKFGEGVEPRGEASPEKAAEALIRAGLALDVERAIALVDPKEGRALHDYAPLFIDDAEAAASEADFSGTLNSIEFSSKSLGDGRTAVSLEKFDFDVSIEGETASVTFDGECVNVEAPDLAEDEGRYCPDDAPLPAPIAEITTKLPSTGIVAVQRDGAWFVSPTRTLFEAIIGALEAIDREDLDELSEFFAEASEETFEEEFVSPEAELEAAPGDLDDDGLIGGYNQEEFSELTLEEQQRAYEREFEERAEEEGPEEEGQ
jgi:hypothetical protein